MAHAILGPSASHRWLVCTPSARFEEQIPREDSADAQEGTDAHELAASVLRVRLGLSRENIPFAKYPQDMADYAEEYANFVRQYDYLTAHVEQVYKFDEFVPLGFGTADCALIGKDAIYVIDYKYGQGVPVSAYDNPQLKMYALGVFLKYGVPAIKTITLAIYQPRTLVKSSTYTLSVSDLLDWAENTVKPLAAKAFAGIGEFKAGPHCRFCGAKTVCREYYKLFAEVAEIMGEPELIDPREITASQRAKILTIGDTVVSWVKKVQDETIKALERKETIPGFKLVEGRGRRTFTNESEVIERLAFEDAEIFDEKLKSLTELEKIFGKKRFNELLADLIIKTPGAPNLAPEDDPRRPIAQSRADDFD